MFLVPFHGMTRATTPTPMGKAQTTMTIEVEEEEEEEEEEEPPGHLEADEDDLGDEEKS